MIRPRACRMDWTAARGRACRAPRGRASSGAAAASRHVCLAGGAGLQEGRAGGSYSSCGRWLHCVSIIQQKPNMYISRSITAHKQHKHSSNKVEHSTAVGSTAPPFVICFFSFAPVVLEAGNSQFSFLNQKKTWVNVELVYIISTFQNTLFNIALDLVPHFR